MKILLTSDWYVPAVNGVVTSLLALRRQLRLRGHEVRVLTLSGSRRSGREGGVYFLGSVDAGRIYPGARLRMPESDALLRELIAWGPDIVHSQCEFSTFAPARRIARACGVPLVHTYHTVYEDYTHYFSPSRRWGRALVRGFTRSVAARCDAMYAPTAKVRDLLEGYGVTCPVYTLPTGIDTARFANVRAGDAAWLRDRLGIGRDRPVLLYLGRLGREKRVDALLDLIEATPGATLLLVGDGPERPRLEAEARARGLDAVFAGMADPAEVPLWYAAADIFVSASTSETQGLTYLEALAAGLPVVCRADPCLEGVVADGVNGLLCPDTAAMVRAAAALLADGEARRAMGRRAAASAQAFSEQVFASRAETLYRMAILTGRESALALTERIRVWSA